MGTSLYYTVRRMYELSDEERSTIGDLVKEFAVEDQIEAYMATGEGTNWESFTWRSAIASNQVLTGSVRLPDLTTVMFVSGVNHWGRLLGRIRCEVLADAEWQVHIEGDEFAWLEHESRYGIAAPGAIDEVLI